MGEIRRFYINFLHRPLEEYQKFTAYTFLGVGIRVAFFLCQCFGHVICLPAKEADMPAPDAVVISEMFRRLRSAKLSHVADTFIDK